METQESVTKEGTTQSSIDIHNYLRSLLATTSTENPLEYIHAMYDSVSPAMIIEGLSAAKETIKKENSKQGNQCDAFLCIGGDNINEMFFHGVITALLWLPKYLDDAVELFKLNRQDVDICKSVLDKINLPKMFDAYDIKDKEGKTVKVNPSNCRHYASFLTAVIQWATTTATDFKQEGEPRSNIEVARYLAAAAMNTFPSIPFCSYYVGSCKTKDATELAEKLTKSIQLNKYMSDIAYQINQPRFVISINGAPLVGISGHPFSNMLVGTMSPETNKAEWFNIYCDNAEFERLCTQNSFTKEEVKNYVLGTDKEKHAAILATPSAKYHALAKFVESNHILSYGFDRYHKYDKITVYNREDSYEV